MYRQRLATTAIISMLALIGCAPAAFAQTSGSAPIVSIHQFSGTDGANPNGGLTAAADGSLYGTTYAGGANGAGVLFKVATDGTETVLHNFGADGSDGVNPSGRIALGSDGSIYGATVAGGTQASGTIYKLEAKGSYTVLHSFDGGAEGASPYGGVTLASDGRLYGATFSGGSGGVGTIYACAADGSLTVLHSFSGLDSSGDNTDGGLVYGSLCEGTDHALYGAAAFGGVNGSGTVFRTDAAGTFVTLHHFAAATSLVEGANPYAGVIQASDGNFYGTTYAGGINGSGSIYRIDSSGIFATVHSFSSLVPGGANADGGNPSAPLTQGSDGLLYGTAGFGGQNGSGSLYTVSTTGAFNAIYQFPELGSDMSATSAARPYGPVTQAPGGALYAGGYYGGSAASGELVCIAEHVFSPGLQMFSVPFDYSGGGLAGVLSQPSSKLAIWQPGQDDYAVTPTAPADTLHQGCAYWARFSAGVSLIAAGRNLATSSSPFTISLKSGWNMIGDPFAMSAPLSALVVIESSGASHTWQDAVSKGLVMGTLYSYTSGATNYAAVSSGSLQPYAGYWLDAAEPVTLQVPLPK